LMFLKRARKIDLDRYFDLDSHREAGGVQAVSVGGPVVFAITFLKIRSAM